MKATTDTLAQVAIWLANLSVVTAPVSASITEATISGPQFHAPKAVRSHRPLRHSDGAFQVCEGF